MEIDRRDVLKAAGLTAAAVAATASIGAAAQVPAPASGPYAIKPLPFDPKSIKGLSERILVSHHDNNYAGAVRRLNAIQGHFRALDNAGAPNFPRWARPKAAARAGCC